MTSKQNLKPDWELWEYMPKVELWQAVALACNIEPDSLTCSGKFKFEGTSSSSHGIEFSRRLRIALANVDQNGLLKTENHDRGVYQIVKLRDFCLWVESMNWPLPNNLLLFMLPEYSLKNPEGLLRYAILYPDAIFGGHQEIINNLPVLELRHVVALSVGLDPIFASGEWAVKVCESIGKELPSFSSSDDAIKQKNAIIERRFIKIAKALGKINLERLKEFVIRLTFVTANLEPDGALHVEKKNDILEESTVRLTNFVVWAKSKGWGLPEELTSATVLVENMLESDTENNKLLKQIAILSLLLAEKSSLYKYGDTPNANKIADAVQEALEKEVHGKVTNFSSHGLGKSSIRESISTGLKLLNQ